jgi:hypothetical protein
MKDWCSLTLFRRWGAFASSVTLAMTIGIITPASAGATDYRAIVAGGCPPTEVVPPFSDPPSPTPVVASGGGELSGGIVRAASTPTAEVHTGARPTHVFSSDHGDCSSSAVVNIDDIVIQGPPGFVHVRLHLPFHANFFHEATRMTDGVNQIHSGATGEVAFNVAFFGARAIVQVNMNSEASPRVAFQGFGNGAEFVSKPRIPGLIPIDPGGFVTLFFQNSLPVTGGVGVPFAGFQTDAIDELRGEIILTADVPANTPLTLTLPMTNTVTAGSFFITGAFSAIGQAAIGLPSDGAQVFELPDGYTSQVPSAGVINNVVPPAFKCTQTVASWLTHPNDWPLPFMTLGTQTYTHDDLLGILKTATSALRPDVSVVLAQQLIAARFNQANGSAPGPMLALSMAADSLLAGFNGRLPYRVNPTTATGQQMMNTAIQLNNYNAGRLTAPACIP